MALTNSFEKHIPEDIRQRYVFAETRDAAGVLAAACPEEWSELLDFLREFKLHTTSLMLPGGSKSKVVEDLEGLFYAHGWEETRIDSERILYRVPKKSGEKKPVKLEGPKGVANSTLERLQISKSQPHVSVETLFQEGYLVDALKGKMAVDIEWNAKDGNLDRDISAYRAWYDFEQIVGAVLITKDLDSCRELLNQICHDFEAKHPKAKGKMPVDLGTTTTTSIQKARERIKRGDAGGCPVLVIGITKNTWDGEDYVPDSESSK